MVENKKMRLKYIFFPVILILATAVFFGYVKPEIDSLRTMNEDYSSNLQVLQGVQSKKSAIDSLNTKISADVDGSALIYGYVPKEKVEEEIIGKVNYLAANSGVFLDNIEISSAAASNALITGPVASDAIQSTQATVVVEGDYDKLKIFFHDVQHVSLFNSIVSLNITSVEKNASTADASVGQGATVTTGQTSSTIVAKLVINFGYLKLIKADDKRLSNFKPEIDSAVIQSLKGYVSGTSPKVSTTGVVMGSSNPFLP